MKNKIIRSQNECNATILSITLLAGVFGSIISIIYFLIREMDLVGFMAQTVNIVISLSIVFFLSRSNNKPAYTKPALLYYFAYLFIGSWWALSYKHPIVIIYAIVVLVNDILLLEKKDRLRFLIPKVLIMLFMLNYDMNFRQYDHIDETYKLGKTIGCVVVTSMLGYSVLKYRQMIDDRVETLESFSFYDPLTGARNSRALSDDLDIAYSRYERDQLPFTIMNIDINGFKWINDTYGHHVGDSVLKETVSILNKLCRRSDYLYRKGGDEFIVLLTGADVNQASMFINRVAQEPMYHSLEYDFDISISFGLADIQESIASKTDVMVLSDERMYVMKKEYGNVINFEKLENRGVLKFKSNLNSKKPAFGEIKKHFSLK